MAFLCCGDNGPAPVRAPVSTAQDGSMGCLIALLVVLAILLVPFVGPVLLMAAGVVIYAILEHWVAIVVGFMVVLLLFRAGGWLGEDLETWKKAKEDVDPQSE